MDTKLLRSRLATVNEEMGKLKMLSDVCGEMNKQLQIVRWLWAEKAYLVESMTAEIRAMNVDTD